MWMEMKMSTKELIQAFREAEKPKPIISVCGWCPDKDAKTAALKAQGYQVSHGLCHECHVKFFDGQ
jgi:hypothetical protein